MKSIKRFTNLGII